MEIVGWFTLGVMMIFATAGLCARKNPYVSVALLIIGLVVTSFMPAITKGAFTGTLLPSSTLSPNAICENVGDMKIDDYYCVAVKNQDGEIRYYQFKEKPPVIFKVVGKNSTKKFISYPSNPLETETNPK